MRRIRQRYGRSTDPKDQLRDDEGQYAVALERLCRCGHRKGEHAAGAKGRSLAECIAHEMPGGPADFCGCEKFRAAPIKK